MTVEQRIQNFLDDHPTGTLYVAAAYASVWGLAWLNKHTPGRPTELLIGNMQKEDYISLSEWAYENALAFLDRSDVTVVNWKRNDDSKTRVAAWLVPNEDSPRDWASHHLLIGSAYLNWHSLTRDDELMAEVAEADARASVKGMRRLYRKAKDCRKTLRDYIQQDNSSSSNWW